MPVTINDVAKEAGVSPSTVSKVLNNWTTISEPTIEKVHKAIEKLNYTPNIRAVNFAKQSTRNIIFLACLKKDEAYLNPHMFDIICGANSEISKLNYHMTLIDSSLDTVPGESVKKILAQKYADGMIIHGSAINKETILLISEHHYPHIIIGRPDTESDLCWIDTNHALAGQYAAKHLLDYGYQRVSFIGGRKSDLISMQRQKGFLSTMYSYGYHVPDSFIAYTDCSVKGSYEAACKILHAKTKPDAIVCEDNEIAIGAIKAIKEANLRIPQEIGLLTFDSFPYANIMEPTPTIIDINMYDIGIQAATTIIQKVANPSLHIQGYITLPVVKPGLSTRKQCVQR